MPPLPCHRSSLRCHRPWRLHRAAKAALGATVFVACLHFPSAGCVERQCCAWRRGLHRCHRTPVRLMPCRAMLCRAVPRRDGQTASNTAAGISATCVLTSAIDTMATLFAATVIFGEGRRVTRRSSVPVPSPSARPPTSSLARFIYAAVCRVHVRAAHGAVAPPRRLLRRPTVPVMAVPVPVMRRAIRRPCCAQAAAAVHRIAWRGGGGHQHGREAAAAQRCRACEDRPLRARAGAAICSRFGSGSLCSTICRGPNAPLGRCAVSCFAFMPQS